MDIEYRITFLIAKVTVINLIVDENGHDFLKQSDYYRKNVEKKANKELVSLGIVLIHLLNTPSNSANFFNLINHGLFPKIKQFIHKKFSTKNKLTYKKKCRKCLTNLVDTTSKLEYARYDLKSV